MGNGRTSTAPSPARHHQRQWRLCCQGEGAPTAGARCSCTQRTLAAVSVLHQQGRAMGSASALMAMGSAAHAKRPSTSMPYIDIVRAAHAPALDDPLEQSAAGRASLSISCRRRVAAAQGGGKIAAAAWAARSCSKYRLHPAVALSRFPRAPTCRSRTAFSRRCRGASTRASRAAAQRNGRSGRLSSCSVAPCSAELPCAGPGVGGADHPHPPPPSPGGRGGGRRPQCLLHDSGGLQGGWPAGCLLGLVLLVLCLLRCAAGNAGWCFCARWKGLYTCFTVAPTAAAS